MCFRETPFTALQQGGINDLLRVSVPVQINRVIIKLASTVVEGRPTNLMSRMNQYREQRSRILVLRSRISFSRRVIAPKHTPHLCELLHFTPYVSLLQTDTFRMLPPICVPKYVAIYSEGGKISPQTPITFPHIRPR